MTVVDLSVARRRWCGLFWVEVVQFEADLLPALGAYGPSLSSVIACRSV